MRMTMLAALIAATPALAQEPPSTVSLGAHSGTFEAASDIDSYRVALQEGKDYALGARVLNGDGRFTVKGTACSDVSGDGEGWGCEFRAGRTGYFTIEAREVGGAVGQTYSFRIERDCRRNTQSRCQLKPGASLSGPLTYGEDVDMIKLTGLVVGRSYTVTLAATIAAEAKPSASFKATATSAWLTVRGLDPYTNGGTYKVGLR